MFGKILNFRFPSVSEAKLAASFCSEKFGSKISDYNIVICANLTSLCSYKFLSIF